MSGIFLFLFFIRYDQNRPASVQLSLWKMSLSRDLLEGETSSRSQRSPTTWMNEDLHCIYYSLFMMPVSITIILVLYNKFSVFFYIQIIQQFIHETLFLNLTSLFAYVHLLLKTFPKKKKIIYRVIALPYSQNCDAIFYIFNLFIQLLFVSCYLIKTITQSYQRN